MMTHTIVDESRSFEATEEGIPRNGDGHIPGADALWESDPLPFPRLNLPKFPVTTLPPALRDFCEASAANKQTPVDLQALLGLAVISACTQGKLVIDVNGDGSWVEQTSL